MRPAFAISLLAALLLALVVRAQDAPVTAEGRFGDMVVFALADDGVIAAEWRRLSAGTPPVSFSVTGLEGVAPREIAYRSRADGIRAIILTGGDEAADIAWQLDVAGAVAHALVGTGSSLTLMHMSPRPMVLGEFDVGEAASIGDMIASVRAESDRLEGQVVPAQLADALEMIAEMPAPLGQRTAIIAPAASFPAFPDARRELTSRALSDDIAFYVTAVEDEAVALALATDTGGSVFMRGLTPMDGDTIENALAPLFSGGAVAFDIPPEQQYRLPGEEVMARALAIQIGNTHAQMPLNRPVPVLSNGDVALGMVNPLRWSEWLMTPGRRAAGAGGLALALVVLGLIALALLRVFGGKAAAPIHHAQPRVPPLLKIGRSSACHVRLEVDSVSRHHATLHHKNRDAFQLSDEASSNGTFIHRGGEWQKIRSTTVSRGDMLRFGNMAISMEDLLAGKTEAAKPVVTASGGTSDAGLERYNAPRRNPYTGEIEEGG